MSKKPLSHSDYDNWKTLNRPIISNDGNWVSYEINPQKGDGWLHLQNPSNNFHDSLARGNEAQFSSSSDLLVFKIKQPEDTIHKLKLAKTKKEDLPHDSLGIWNIQKDSVIAYSDLKSFILPREGGSWIAMLQEKAKEKPAKKEADTLKTGEIKDTLTLKQKEEPAREKTKKPKKGAFSDTDTWTLNIMNPLTSFSMKREEVTETAFSKNGYLCAFITLDKDSIDSIAIHVFDTRSLQERTIFKTRGFAKKIIADDAGKQLSFLFTTDTAKIKRYGLYLWNEKPGLVLKIADTASAGIPSGWEVSENGSLSFSEDGNKLYFATCPKAIPAPMDTLLEEEKVKVDIWNWQDDRLQSQQIKELDDDLKKTYLAVYRIPEKKILQLADTLIPDVKTTRKGNGDLAIGYSELPYLMLTSWEDANYRDIFLIDLKSGIRKKTLVKKAFTANLSPDTKFLYWYESSDKSWMVMDLQKSQIRNVSQSIPVPFYTEDHDTPSVPGPYGIAGWTDDDGYLLLYDRYDIWQVDPRGLKAPVNLTNGRKEKHVFRYVALDTEALSIHPLSILTLKTTEEESGRQGFVNLSLDKPGIFTFLTEAAAEYSQPIKAKNGESLIWQRSTYTQYPDLWYSQADFSEVERLSNTNPQQSGFLWGSMEQVDWTNLEGKKLKGLLYKPENMDTTRKYPMIVYFYEKYSDKPFTHYVPNPSRSIVNFPFYNSNGYIVFVPDITYTTGHPGNDAYIAIMSGVMEMMKRPYVDAKHMGLQGQSWGGYQTAYMVTRTGLFKAAMAGAPVSNMTSAYGGIRWESGMVRQFQYEQSQSRIGGTLWDSRDLYIENSPIFFVDRITTPLLIMSNDNDGAVPWYQGIELFTAMRRLGKPAWMLTYNGDEHNLTKRPNRMDLSIRMNQFFDHYLKDAPMPVWMDKGLPAIKKGKELRYELED